MDDANRVLEILYDRGDFVLADELARITGFNREQLDAAMAELSRRGHSLEIRPARGVCLGRPLRLDAHLIERDLGTRRVGRSVLCFDEVDSTNDVAMDSARRDDSDGLVITAESQRAGRGRQGRPWLSAPGEGLLFSILLLDNAGPLPHEAVTIAAGLAAAEGIDESCGLACRLRWPNDVHLEGAKAAGVLVETRSRGGDEVATVVGIGINVYSAPRLGRTDRPATHLSRWSPAPDRIDLLRHILRRMDFWLAEIAVGRFDALHDAWVGRCGMIHDRIRVVSGGAEHVGRVIDVSPLEGLVLACDDGRHVRLPAATSTVI